MPSARTHPEEIYRLATLRSLCILDTPSEPTFDRLTRLARELFGMPIAAISLVDEHRQWFKSILGLAVTETARCDAFCAHTILSPDLMLVTDALTDQRVRDNRLVTGEPGIRFYAGMPILAANGVPIGAFCVIDVEPREWSPSKTPILADLAALAGMAIESRMQDRRASAAMDAKRLFAANMSHEIRTPLGVIQGHAELLSQCVPGSDEARQSLEVIGRSTRHLADITEAILEFAAIDANTVRLQFERFNAAAILDSLQPLVARAATERGLAIHMRWCGEQDVMVTTDPARLRRVLHNLVSNAIRFTPSGSVSVVGFVDSSREDATQLHFTVSDTGPGMSQEQFEQAVQPFTQLDYSHTRAHGGLGLGLSVAASIVRCLGGSLALSSTSGTGCTFDVSVPCVAGERAESRSLPRVDSTTDSGKSLSGYRVLLADDCVDNQRLISVALGKVGAEVDVVSNGALAVEAARSSHVPFDVILMDMQMPVMNGCDATRRLRELGYVAPVIAFTANAMPADRDACFAAGCDDFLTKPISRGALVSRILKLPRTGSRAAA